MMSYLMLLCLMFLLNMKEETFYSQLLEISNFNNFLVMISLMFLSLFSMLKFKAMKNLEEKFIKFSFLLILITSNLCFWTSNMFTYLLMLEMSVYPMMKIFLNLSKDKEKMESMMFMFMINMAGSMFLMIYVMKMKTLMNLNFMKYQLSYSEDYILMFMFSFMLLTKVPMIFSQFWLSKAHVAASGACSMLLAAVMLKLGSYGIMKFCLLFNYIFKSMENYITALNATSLLIFTLIMMRFSDMKLLVAHSSIMHMSLTIPFTFFYSNMAVVSVIFMLVSHGLISSIYFFMVTIVYEMSKNRSMEMNKSMESYMKTLTMFLFLVVLLNLGIPPMMNMLTELMYFCISFKMSYMLMMLIMTSMAMSILYCMNCILMINYGKKIMNLKKNLNTSIYSILLMMMMIMIFLPFLVQ